MKIIFIASAPRSGSTWFSSIFDSHPDVIYRHEALARTQKLRQTDLLTKLKYNYGLDPHDRDELLQILLTGGADTNRPPFFPKSYSSMPPLLLHLLWVGAIKFSCLEALFRRITRISSPQSLTMVIKETGWSVHLPSIIAGIRPDYSIFLLRHPCAIIASIKKGISLGLMRRQTIKNKISWYKEHKDMPFIQSNNLTEKHLKKASDVEFWAIKLRVLYDLFIDIQQNEENNIFFVVYEKLVSDPISETRKTFKKIRLPLYNNTLDFLNKSTRKATSLRLPESNSEYFSVHRNKKIDPYKWKYQLHGEEIHTIIDIIGLKILTKFWA